MWAILLGGVLPDSDFLLLPFPFFNQVHRVITHNIPFILVSGIIIALPVKGRRISVALSLMFGGLLHLLIDACMDANPSNGIGVAILWPFYDGYFSPFNLAEPSENIRGWENPLGMIKMSLRALRFEIPLCLAAVPARFFKRKTG